MKETTMAESESKRPNIKTVVTDFGNATTLHGIQYVVQDGMILYRLCWSAICIGFAAVFVIQATQTVNAFFSYPHSTNIEIASQPSLEFPAVTVCNANRMRRSKLIDTPFEGLIDLDGGTSGADYDYSWWFSSVYALSSSSSNSSSSASTTDSPSSASNSSAGGSRRRRKRREQNAKESWSEFDGENSDYSSPQPRAREERNTPYSSIFSWFDPNANSDFQYYDDGWDDVTSENDWEGFYQNSKADDYSDFIDVVKPTREELAGYGHQLEDFVLQCTFDRRPCNISTDFTTWQNKYFGNCFTFNSAREGQNSTRSTGKTGALNGLHLTLFVEQPEYLGILSPHTGAKVTLHDSHVYPFPEEDAIDLPTGMATSIGIRQESIQRLGGRYTNCTRDGSNTNFTTASSSVAYSTENCRKTCYQQYLYKFCDCVDDAFFVNLTDECKVLNQTQQWCRQYIEDQFIDDKLECSCPTACNETKFLKTISGMVWPSERYEEHLYAKIAAAPGREKVARMLQSTELTRKNFVRVKIYYEELNFERVMQVPVYTFTSLMGNVGGLMGLYIGMSFISIFEVTFLVLRICKILARKFCCRNHIQPPKDLHV